MFRFFENLVDPYCDYPVQNTPPNRLWPFILSYAKPFRKVFWWTGAISIIVGIIEVSMIFYLGRVVDLMAISTPQRILTDYGLEFVLAAAFILIVWPLIEAFGTGLLNNAILPNFGTLIRWRSHRHVLNQSVGWFENDFAGRIANRIMQTPPAAGEAVFQIFDAVSFSIAYLVGASVLLMTADPRLLIPLMIWFVLYGMLVRWTMRRVGPASKKSSDARSAVTGLVVDAYTNVHSVKLFDHSGVEMRHARTAIEHSRKTFQHEMRIYTIMTVSLTVLNALLIVGVVGWAIILWAQGSATAGIVAAASVLTLRLNAMTGWIMWALSSLFQNMGIISEGMETIAQPIELVDLPDAMPLQLTAGRIETRALSHHYGKEAGGLDQINLVIPAGQKVGLVGRSGAGKTTLVKLLLRFYDPDGGQILIDNQDIRAVTQHSLRKQIGMVPQDSALMHRSVRDNILYGRPNSTEEQMIAAARQAEAHEFILDLEDPEGRRAYDAHVGERGVKLSGGQRQRIVLARVILKDAPILLLDEATSALDSEVEAAIQETLYDMMEGKTVVAIAHRLSTIARLDRILVLDQGHIVEDGSHAELMAAGGLYAHFWARQSGGFIGTEEAAE